MSTIPASPPPPIWWYEQSRAFLLSHMRQPSEATLRSLWEFNRQYLDACQRGMKPLQYMP